MTTVMQSVNGYGTPVSLHRCDYCGNPFTVTPATDDAWGLGCLAEGCPSYDITRDVDLFWDWADVRTEPIASKGETDEHR